MLIIATYFVVRAMFIIVGTDTVRNTSSVSIIAGTGPLSATDIVHAANIHPGTNISNMNLGNILRDIENLPGVRDASVRRAANGKLFIRVSQHTAFATWTDGQLFYPISCDGRIIGTGTGAAAPGLLVFKGTIPGDVTEIINIIKSNPIIKQRIRHISWIDERRFDLHTMDGVRIKLPEENINQTINRLVTMHQQNRILDRRIVVLDLRDANRTLTQLQ